MIGIVKTFSSVISDHAKHLWDWYGMHPGATGIGAGGGAIALVATRPSLSECQTVFEHIWNGGPPWIMAFVSAGALAWQAKKSRDSMNAVKRQQPEKASGGDHPPTPPGKV